MKITITVELDVVPGTLKTEEEIKDSAGDELRTKAFELAAGYGPPPYQVIDVKLVP